jgi:hypothetical protein
MILFDRRTFICLFLCRSLFVSSFMNTQSFIFDTGFPRNYADSTARSIEDQQEVDSSYTLNKAVTVPTTDTTCRSLFNNHRPQLCLIPPFEYFPKPFYISESSFSSSSIYLSNPLSNPVGTSQWNDVWFSGMKVTMI